jgi:AraC-like DNA-binding protein
MHMLEWPVSFIPRIAVAGRFSLGDRRFGTRYRGGTHALHLHGYAGRMRLGGREIAIAPGDATLSPAGEPSGYDLDAPGSHWCIHFAPAEGEAVIALPLHLPAARAGRLREGMAHVSALFASARGDAVGAARAGLALQELLLGLSQPEVVDSPADRAAAFIDAHFHEALAVADVGAAIGRSPAHLARLFRTRFGVTMPHYLLERRAAHARFLLESTDLPIWRVAERVGIPDAQHFNKTIRRLLGASPSAIRAGVAGPRVDPDR